MRDNGAMDTLTLLDYDAEAAARIVDVPVWQEMSDSFMAYALSVITARAIPDVRDGLKPVQRRVLWSMLQMRLRPGTPYRKSARVVGDTMGRYHPHGDAAIYDTLVRMGQDFARMVTLVDPQGNFGSLDDPPAASRYTECRLAAAAMDIVGDIDESTVDMVATYDGEGLEPSVMPAALPNLIINGVTGIAVGMATTMCSHNPGEVADAIDLVMSSRRKVRTDDLLAVLPGPDFSGGGIVISDDGLRSAYETGTGKIRVRALMEAEPKRRPRQIIVTEFPPNVGAEKIVSTVCELAAAGRLPGVRGATDLSDIDGTRLRIDLDGTVAVPRVTDELCRLTPLETSISVNNVVLDGGVPVLLGFVDLCQRYIAHRMEVVVRRSQHRLDAAQKRLHLAEGLLTAVDNLDEVVRIIRKSKDPAAARAALMKRFALSTEQAEHILDMTLRRLTALEKLRLNQERTALLKQVEEYTAILGSVRRQRTLVKNEMRSACETHGKPRRSAVVDAAHITAAAPIAAAAGSATATVARRSDPCVLTVSSSGNAGRADPTERLKRTPGRHDLVIASLRTSTADSVTAVTDRGIARRAVPGDAAAASGRARGAAAAEMFALDRHERVVGLFSGAESTVVAVAASGLAKRVAGSALAAAPEGTMLMNLDKRDRIVAVFAVHDTDSVLVLSSAGLCMRVEAAQLPTLTLGRAPSALMGLPAPATAVAAGAVDESAGGVVAIVTDHCGIKLVDAFAVPAKGRGAQGVIVCRLGDGEHISTGWVGPATETLLAVCAADDGRRDDPHPERLRVKLTNRYTQPDRSGRQIRVVAPGRS